MLFWTKDKFLSWFFSNTCYIKPISSFPSSEPKQPCIDEIIEKSKKELIDQHKQESGLSLAFPYDKGYFNDTQFSVINASLEQFVDLFQEIAEQSNSDLYNAISNLIQHLIELNQIVPKKYNYVRNKDTQTQVGKIWDIYHGEVKHNVDQTIGVSLGTVLENLIGYCTRDPKLDWLGFKKLSADTEKMYTSDQMLQIYCILKIYLNELSEYSRHCQPNQCSQITQSL